MTIVPEIERQLRDAAERMARSPVSRALERTRRWRGRLLARPLTIVLAALVVAGGSALAAGLLSGRHSRPLTAVFPPGSPLRQTGYGPPGSSYDISISPSMQTGVIGWCTSLVTYRGTRRFDLGTGGCNGAPPAVDAPVFGADDGGIGVAALSYVFTAPQVAAVRVKDGPTILTRADPRLPFGFRTAVFSLPGRLSHVGVALTALDATGQMISGDAYAQPVIEGTRSWRAPEPPAAGACSVSARGGSGIVLRSGSVLSSAIGDPGIIGRAFLPCLNASFTLHGRSFAAAVLLDATRPGRLPAQLPDMLPVAGHPGVLARKQAMTNLLGRTTSTSRRGESGTPGS